MIDIIVGFIFVMIPVILIVFGMIESWHSDKRDKEMQDIIHKLEAFTSTLSKQEDFPIIDDEPFEYELVLWWGLDGIRLNKDGTTEWISRKKKIEYESVPVPQIVTPMPTFPIWSCYNPCYNTATQINHMNMWNDMQASQTRIAQLQQLNAMCQNTIRPSDAMNYLVERQIDQCCCNMNNYCNINH